MKPSDLLKLHREQICAIALTRRVHDVRVFGSVANQTEYREPVLSQAVPA
jgi:hypothetical protein